jgi:DNA polymerase III epsilon subunit-like protein
MIGSELLRSSFEEKLFCIWDLETESLNLRYARPWELYFQINKGSKILEKHLFYIKWPDLKVSEGAARITGFNPQKIADFGKEPAEVLDFFDKYLYDDKYLIIGTNIIGFDSMIHNLWRNAVGKSTDYSWLNRLYDTNILAKMYRLQLNKPKDCSISDWNFKLNGLVRKGVKTGIDSMSTALEIPINKDLRHTASYDCSLTFEIFKKLVWKLEI